MDIKYINPGYAYILDSIMQFQQDDTSSFWNDSLFFFYKELDKEYAYSLSLEKRREYISSKLMEVYRCNESLFNEKVEQYRLYWKQYRIQVNEAFSEIFEMDCSNILNDLVCNISLNPVSPRFLERKSFDVFYLNSEKGAIGNALHELTHFVWFVVWNQLFQDTYDEYEAPSLKWILSELVVEAIMSDERLCSINPYYPRENGGCIYPYFFTMEIEGKPITDTICELFKTYGIKDFMRESYQFCLKNQEEIRNHIMLSES